MHNGHDLPVYFASKSWSKCDSMKSTPVQECMAIHFALTQFRPYVYGVPILVRTDHKSLIYLFTHKSLSPKLMRIRLDLEDYNFTIEHISGAINVVADALSRITINDLIDLYGKTSSILAITRSKTREMNEINAKCKLSKFDKVNKDEVLPCYVPITEQTNAQVNKNIPRIICKSIKEKDKSSQECEVIYMNVFKNYKKLFSIVMTNVSRNDESILKEAMTKLQVIADKYKISDLQWSLNDEIFKFFEKEILKRVCRNVLYKLHVTLINKPIELTSASQRKELLTEFYDSPIFGGHCGPKKLYHNLRVKYYWKGMRRDVATFVKNCNKCKLTKVTVKNREPMVITRTPLRPFDVLVIDTIGPLPTSKQGNRYAVTIVCDLSKYLVIIPIPDKQASTVAKAIFKKIRSDIRTYAPNPY